MNVKFEKPFPAAYVVELCQSAPNEDFVFGRPDSSSTGEIILEVISDSGKSWVGVARAGTPSVRGTVSGVFSTPAKTVLCVVARGDAFLVDVEAPHLWKAISTGGPVMTMRPVLGEDLLLLGSPWSITAIGKDGVRWQTDRLAIEGIRLDEVAEGRLAGVSDPDDDEPQNFVVDLHTGQHEGGVPLT